MTVKEQNGKISQEKLGRKETEESQRWSKTALC